MSIITISVERDERDIDVIAVCGEISATFPESIRDPEEAFSCRLELMRRIGAPEVVVRSTERLAERVGPCYVWRIPQPGGLEAVRCHVRRDEFSCIVEGALEPAMRARILALARAIGTVEILE